MLKDKIDKKNTQFFFKKNPSELESTSQTLDASHACH
jgi:hypothetical protein